MDPEEAKGALAADALAATPPTYFPNEGVDGDFLLGRTLALAGRAREAIPRLEKAASRCNALRGPFELVQSHLFLGRAREDEHDVANACAEYDEVLRRWGDAKPRSVTAEQARARRTALRCP
jgi:serine/threonine-protein kinase